LEKIEKEHPFDEADKEIVEIRAASIVTCEKLVQHSSRSLAEIDGFLWRAPKTGEMEQLFQKGRITNSKQSFTRKPLICYTMHF
jgi:hypothetical protein